MALKHHLILVGVRVLAALLVMSTLPASHLRLGQNPELAGVDGPPAFALLLGLTGIGLLLGVMLLVAGTAVHLVFRHRLRVVLAVDLVLAIVLLILALDLGLTVTYGSAAG